MRIESTARAVSCRRLLVVLLAVVAMIIGVAAVHSMTTPLITTSSVEPAAPATLHMTNSADASIGGVLEKVESSAVGPEADRSVLEGCDGSCQMEMGGVLCVLALLAVAMGVLRIVRRSGGVIIDRCGPRGARAITPPSATRRRPSLTVLSISRT